MGFVVVTRFRIILLRLKEEPEVFVSFTMFEIKHVLDMATHHNI